MFQFCLQLAFALVAQLPVGTTRSQWYGELDAGERIFRFVIAATLDASGAWQGELRSLDEGGAKFKLDSFEISDSQFTFQLKQTKASYSGRFNESGKRDMASGIWSQAGTKFNLTFRLVEVVPTDQPKETWLGEMVAGLNKLEMQVRRYWLDGGSQLVLIDSLSQGVGGFKGQWQAEGDTIEIDVKSLASKFSGKQSADGTQIVGKWKQGIANLDLNLRKIERPRDSDLKPPKRPQTPQSPFPYEADAVSFDNSAAGIQFKGTLTIPHSTDRSQRFPAAILVSGSGPQDRDETLFGHKPFWVLADHLSRKGFVVLRYDERGVGESGGKFDDATTADFAQDAASAVEFLKKHPRVDSKSIGLIGHSEGGLVAPLVACQDDQVAWIVLMAGPGVNGAQITFSQGRLMILAAGGDEATIQRNRLVQEAAFSAISQTKLGEAPSLSLEGLVERVLQNIPNIEKTGSAKAATDAEDPAVVRKFLSEAIRANVLAMSTPWFRFFMDHEPGPILERVRCPVLAINGEKDVQVDPQLNLPKIAQSLKAGGNSTVTIVELPNLNHLFQTSSSGALSEYGAIEETIAPLALNTISEWLAKITQ